MICLSHYSHNMHLVPTKSNRLEPGSLQAHFMRLQPTLHTDIFTACTYSSYSCALNTRYPTENTTLQCIEMILQIGKEVQRKMFITIIPDISSKVNGVKRSHRLASRHGGLALQPPAFPHLRGAQAGVISKPRSRAEHH